MKKLVFLFFLLYSTGLAQNCKIDLEGSIDSNKKMLINNSINGFINATDQIYNNGNTALFQEIAMTDSAKKTLQAIWSNRPFKPRCFGGHAKIEKESQGTGFAVHGIEVQISVNGKEDIYLEKLSLKTNLTGTITDVRYSLGAKNYKFLFQDKDPIEDTRRKMIEKFLENYKSYYYDKDIESIKSIYSDDALIIVGKIIHRYKPVNEKNIRLGLEDREYVQYVEESKEEYIQNLRKVFDLNQHIHITFDSISIEKHSPYPALYDVLVIQTWRAKNYSDLGYLFFVIDFTDEKKPVIYVRVWQEKEIKRNSTRIKNPYFKEPSSMIIVY